jgi:hypothetical protein
VAFNNAFDGIHPTFKQVPPNVSLFSIHTVFKPFYPALIAPTYPPGPPPITAKSYSLTANPLIAVLNKSLL